MAGPFRTMKDCSASRKRIRLERLGVGYTSSQSLVGSKKGAPEKLAIKPLDVPFPIPLCIPGQDLVELTKPVLNDVGQV